MVMGEIKVIFGQLIVPRNDGEDARKFCTCIKFNGRKALWKLKVQPKVRVFWWRVIKNILPAYSELQ